MFIAKGGRLAHVFVALAFMSAAACDQPLPAKAVAAPVGTTTVYESPEAVPNFSVTSAGGPSGCTNPCADSAHCAASTDPSQYNNCVAVNLCNVCQVTSC